MSSASRSSTSTRPELDVSSRRSSRPASCPSATTSGTTDRYGRGSSQKGCGRAGGRLRRVVDQGVVSGVAVHRGIISEGSWEVCIRSGGHLRRVVVDQGIVSE